MAAQGFIKIHRKIEEDEIWNSNEPFDKRSAWIDLILQANHADKVIVIGNQAITIKRGQKFTSIQKLAERWHWGRTKTYEYIKLLETTGKVTRTRTLNGTLLTLIKYDDYQSRLNTVDTTTDTTYGATTDTTTDTQTRSIKNIKNDKRMKKNTPAAFEDF